MQHHQAQRHIIISSVVLRPHVFAEGPPGGEHGHPPGAALRRGLSNGYGGVQCPGEEPLRLRGYRAALKGKDRLSFYGGGQIGADLSLPRLRELWAAPTVGQASESVTATT